MSSGAAGWLERWSRRGRRGAAGFVLLAALAGPGLAQAAQTAQTDQRADAANPSVRDDRGHSLRFDAPPQRVVTLLPSLTEAWCAVGGCALLVGTDRYSNWPASVLALPKLGGLDDAQVERIVALRPDLVLAARSTRAVGRLEALGLRVLAFDSDNHAQVRATLFALARVLGDEARGAAAWQATQAQMAQAAQRVPAALRGGSVYFEVDASPYAAGAASFLGQTLQLLQLRNIAGLALGPFPKLNPEFVLRAQPQVVMAAARNIGQMPKRPGWGALLALQQGRVCAFDADTYELVTRPGPRLGEAALALADCLAQLPLPGPPQATPAGPAR
jgi:iron complex transport system substrate-binding protein